MGAESRRTVPLGRRPGAGGDIQPVPNPEDDELRLNEGDMTIAAVWSNDRRDRRLCRTVSASTGRENDRCIDAPPCEVAGDEGWLREELRRCGEAELKKKEDGESGSGGESESNALAFVPSTGDSGVGVDDREEEGESCSKSPVFIVEIEDDDGHW